MDGSDVSLVLTMLLFLSASIAFRSFFLLFFFLSLFLFFFAETVDMIWFGSNLIFPCKVFLVFWFLYGKVLVLPLSF